MESQARRFLIFPWGRIGKGTRHIIAQGSPLNLST